MRKFGIFCSVLLTIGFLACSGPKLHLFGYDYTPPQALRICRQVLMEQGYQITVFEMTTGVVKTTTRDFVGEKGETIRYQIVITQTKPHELRITVIPRTVLAYRDQIMESLIGHLKQAGIYPRHIPPPVQKPKYWKQPPSSPPPLP
ncbi:MAG: hypothetical protein AMJ92_09525 [candidate division Zixibacteria bacterium SM23_81]|nr:MAG: hypothetical protein AMJ92_09525 [candidate division Zixibacteria bacterium SM23_81]